MSSPIRTLTLPLKGHAVRTVLITVAVRINTDDYGALFETGLGTEPVSCVFCFCFFFFFSGTFERRHGIFHAHEKKHHPAFSPC